LVRLAIFTPLRPAGTSPQRGEDEKQIKDMIKDNFIRKKVSSLTLGEKLRKIRNERRISLNEVSKHTQIQLKYLEYLEEGNYDKLPAEVYVKGFLKSYASFLGVNENSLLKLYNRERGIQRNIKKEKETDSGFERGRLIKISNFVIISKTTAVAFAVVLAILAAAYLFREVDKFVSIPRLTILEPADGIIAKSGAVWVKGITDKDCQVFINGQLILVNDKGEFNEKVNLRRGANFITVKSKNRFGKESSRTISVQSDYEEEIGNADGVKEEAEGEVKGERETRIKAEIYVDSDSVWLSVKVDGSLAYSGTLSPQVKQSFEAKKEISITSGKGRHTFVKINGEDKGALSRDAGMVKDVVFKAADE